MSVSAAILGLAVLIFVHEAGHFVVARAVGMRPRKFYLGFGPPLVKTIRGGVEYGIAAFPLGGYVKIPGMTRPVPGDLRKSLKVEEQEPLREPLAALDAALESGDESAARELLPKLAPHIGKNRIFEELDGALSPDAYWRQKTWKRVVVIAAGPVTNIVFALGLFMAVFMVGSIQATRTVERVLAGHPAATAGLRAGDQIVTIAGRQVQPDTIASNINATHGQPFTITVERAGKRVVLGPLRARNDHGAYRVGFVVHGVSGPGDSLATAFSKSVRVIGEVTSETVRGIGRLFVGSGTHNISSPVGIVRVTSQAYQQSLQDFLGVWGLVSLAIALLNLLPVLPLDGGHILMSILERVRGRAFSQITYLRFSAIGISVFLFLFYLGLRNDLFSGGS
jgi:regulator of sigma E protease